MKNQKKVMKRRNKTQMKAKTKGFVFVDVLLVLMMVVPIVIGIVLKILTMPASDDIVIAGAQIYFPLPMPIQEHPITESQINSIIVMITVTGICLFLTHGIKAGVKTRRQLLAEVAVEKVDGMVRGNMGEYFMGFGPFVAAILALSALSSLMSLVGLFAPTSDLNIVAGWAILVFALITYYKCKAGPWHYVKSFGDPIIVMYPFNVLSEVATPISLACRHFGNVVSGTVIGTLIYAALAVANRMVFGWLPGFLGELLSTIPFLQVGIPAIASIYFVVFSGCLQAYIFVMLSMMYVKDAAGEA